MAENKSPTGGQNQRPGGHGRPGSGAGAGGGPGRSDRGGSGQSGKPSGAPGMRHPHQPPRPRGK